MTSNPAASPRTRPSLFAAAALLLAATLALPANSADWVTDAETAAIIQRLGLIESPAPVRERAGWRKPERILVVQYDPARIEWLQQAVPDVKLVAVDSVAAAVAAAPEADAIIGICNQDVFAAGPRIAWVQILSAGAERCVSVPAIGERDILLTNMQRISGPVMSEHVLAMMLALGRGLPAYLDAQRDGRWDRELVPDGRMWAMEGKTVLVVGLGGIGVEVARRAHALGMKVTAIRASGRTGPGFVSKVGLPAEMPQFAATADFVVNTTPLTDATRGMFDADFFDSMHRGAYFINVGRGQSVVTDALVAALRSGQVGGAGLDVTDPEPLPSDHPLWRLPNVIVTPHVSGQSDLGNEDHWRITRENLGRYVAGGRMLSVVDPARGY
ncbi:MAG TPA: D-2-hydroxyacid dehydrogenase [Steroidobacteraceae bacterium]|nr:D-2-hydroxyacid dehydrogenase [Steroidobacteraceae bacterium]